MSDKKSQSSIDLAESIPAALEIETKELHLAIKHSSFYPEEHPVRVKAANQLCKLLQDILSNQESHSISAIEDELYIDEHLKSADDHHQSASDEFSMDLARKLRQHGIRSVVFYRGIELWELERFLRIMTMKSNGNIVQSDASMALGPSKDVPHVRIVNVDYENVRFVAGDNAESPEGLGEILVSYLRSGSKNLADEAYAHLSSLLKEPDLAANLIENSTYYDGISEPDSSVLMKCARNLINLGENLTDEERREFEKKILVAMLRTQTPVKKTLFTADDDSGLVTRFVNGLSVDDIVEFASSDYTTEGTPIPLHKMLDELRISDQSISHGSFSRRLAEIESAVEDILIGKSQEDIFKTRLIPIFEQIFVELGIDRLEEDQIQLEELLSELYVSPKTQETQYASDEVQELFATEDRVANLAFVLLEMLESETELENYSDLSDQLEEMASAMVMTLLENTEVQERHFAIALQIIDTFCRHAGAQSGKSTVLRDRAEKAIVNIGTEEVVNQALSIWSKSESLEWFALEKFIQQTQGKGISKLVENFLTKGSSAERWKMVKILSSLGPPVIREIHKHLPKCQWNVISRDIIPLLSQIGGTEALDCLSDALDHPHPQVRKASILALMAIGSTPAARLILKKFRNDEEDKFIRHIALSALVEIPSDQVVEEIGEILNGKSTDIKQEAIQALVTIGGEKSISILGDILNQKRLIIGKRRLRELQFHVVEALRQIGTPSAVEFLTEMSLRKRGNLKSALDKALNNTKMV